MLPALKENPVPTSNPLQGGERRYVQTVALMRNESGSGDYSVVSSYFRIWHPSARLHVAATIGFRPDSAEDAEIPTGFVATMDAWAKTSREAGGFPIRGNGILPGPCSLSTQLPWTFEAVTAVDEWRGQATAPEGGTGLQVDGTFYLTVTWEPQNSDAPMADAELRRLFDSCKVQAYGFPTVYATSA